MHYSDYLHTEQILNAQFPESDRLGIPAHDEMLFIVIHQAYELWFKQLLYEVDSINRILEQPLNDNSPALQTVVHRLGRCGSILRVLVHQIDIMETMTPMDFLDFRDLLRPASGFQSVQFKLLEARLGLRFTDRYGQDHYAAQLRPAEAALPHEAASQSTTLQLVNKWLERMPFFDEAAMWENFKSATAPGDISSWPLFWWTYRECYRKSLSGVESANLAAFDQHFSTDDAASQLSAKARRAALFIILYRGYPVLQLPFQLLNNLLEIDEQLSTWRYRHMSMVHRMIGSRVGTGGSTGKDYLSGALQRHHIFADIAALMSFLIERRQLPELSPEMERRLGFIH